MKVLYFDCFSGISGDMTLGALIDLGVDRNAFKSELDKLGLDGYKINITNKLKNGIAGIDVDVILSEDCGNESHADHSHSARNLKSINAIIDRSSLNQKVKDFSKMGIIKCLSSGYGIMPAMSIQNVGYGMGKRETGRFNALRVVMGTLAERNYQ